MRYTEKKYDFKFDSPYDFIRVLFCTTFLAPFRLINEITKKILFLGKNKVKDIVNTGMIIAISLFVGELGYQLIFSSLSVFKGKVPLVSILIALGVLFGLTKLVDTIQLEDMDIFEASTDEESVIEKTDISPKDIEVPVSEMESNDIENNDTPITEDYVEGNKIYNNEILNSKEFIDTLESRLSRYDEILQNDDNDSKSEELNEDALKDIFSEDSLDNLEQLLDPIDIEELSNKIESNSKELLGDNFEPEKFKFDDLVSQYDEIAERRTGSYDAEEIVIEDDFNLDEYIL